MRKPTATLLAVLAVVALAGCGASGEDDASDTTAAAPTTTEAPADETTTEADGDETTTTEEEASGDAVPVEDWAEDFCGGFDTWIGQIQEAGAQVSEGITPGDLEGAKAAFVDLFDTAAAETDTLIGVLADSGSPDIEDGEGLVEDLTGKFEEFKTAIEDAGAEAEAVPTDDPTAFQEQVEALGQTFQEEATAVGDSFGELDSKYPSQDLQSALSESCTSI
ncbi:MAG TPA: hypothetical protein VHK88_13835 [Aquihabitans sp.]|jgi:soluble cytochrome b562|nr:hypothetical protein [Aquihabitans sp.]